MLPKPKIEWTADLPAETNIMDVIEQIDRALSIAQEKTHGLIEYHSIVATETLPGPGLHLRIWLSGGQALLNQIKRADPRFHRLTPREHVAALARESVPEEPQTASTTESVEPPTQEPETLPPEPAQVKENGEGRLASPAAIALAAKYGIALAEITHKGAIINRFDVVRANKARKEAENDENCRGTERNQGS